MSRDLKDYTPYEIFSAAYRQGYWDGSGKNVTPFGSEVFNAWRQLPNKLKLRREKDGKVDGRKTD